MPEIEEPPSGHGAAGFTIVEFLIASIVFLIAGASIFSMMAETQQTTAYQTEVQSVMESTRIALTTIQRLISEAGNDPLNTGLKGITILGSTEVRLQSDKTGSEGPANPDKGDPDGDTLDSEEDVTIRFNPAAGGIEMIAKGGSPQTLANSITELQISYYDNTGTATNVGDQVKKIRVLVAGATIIENPRTHKKFGLALATDVQIGSRQ